jgi:hypothetical protein
VLLLQCQIVYSENFKSCEHDRRNYPVLLLFTDTSPWFGILDDNDTYHLTTKSKCNFYTPYDVASYAGCVENNAVEYM